MLVAWLQYIIAPALCHAIVPDIHMFTWIVYGNMICNERLTSRWMSSFLHLEAAPQF